MKVLVGYDGSAEAERALEVAIQQAKAFQGTVYVLTSVDTGPDVPREEFERAERNLDRAKNKVTQNHVPCETVLVEDGLSPGEDLVQFAKDEKVDEIVIGVQRRSKVGKLIFGSTVQYVVLKAPCPVITVK